MARERLLKKKENRFRENSKARKKTNLNFESSQSSVPSVAEGFQGTDGNFVLVDRVVVVAWRLCNEDLFAVLINQSNGSTMIFSR